MRDALYNEYTFKFCYNSPIKVPFLMRCFTIYPEKKMLISEAVWKTLQHGAVSAIIHLTANLVMEKRVDV